MSVDMTVDLGRKDKRRLRVRGKLDPARWEQFQNEFQRLAREYGLQVSGLKKVAKKRPAAKKAVKKKAKKKAAKK